MDQLLTSQDPLSIGWWRQWVELIQVPDGWSFVPPCLSPLWQSSVAKFDLWCTLVSSAQRHSVDASLTSPKELLPVLITDVAINCIPSSSWSHFLHTQCQNIQFHPSTFWWFAIGMSHIFHVVEGKVQAALFDMSWEVELWDEKLYIMCVVE